MNNLKLVNFDNASHNISMHLSNEDKIGDLEYTKTLQKALKEAIDENEMVN